jgi:hypothetical protein
MKNKQLKDLCEQAGMECSLGHWYIEDKHLERFAELVRQAIEQAEYDKLTVKFGERAKEYLEAAKKSWEPEQEPVAWISDSPTKGNGKQLHFAKADAWKWSSNITPLYAAPPRKEWVGLTDEEVDFIADSEWEEAFVRLVEAKLKERNT